MKKFAALIMVSSVLSLSGCQNSTDISVSAESLANTEYASVEDFKAANDELVFIIDAPETAVNSEPSAGSAFTAVDTNVSVSKSYISVTYECKAIGNTFKTEAVTYRTDNGEEALQSVIDSNPSLFTEKEIGGILTYYCPGGEYDWFDCYSIIKDGKMLVIDIEKGYGAYAETVMKHIVGI